MKKSATLFLFLLCALAVVLTGTNSVRAIPSTTRVSLAHDGQQANKDVMWPDISDNGRYAVFASAANNMLPDYIHGSTIHVYLRDLETGAISLVSKDDSGVRGNANSVYPAISGDGRFVAYASSASNLVPFDTNNTIDIFVYDRLNDSTVRVSEATDGTQANNFSWGASISDDGAVVAFHSHASNLVSEDTNGVSDVFVYDFHSGETTRASLTSAGEQANKTSGDPHVSGNGRFVVFDSAADLTGNGNTASAIYFYDLDTETVERISKKVGFYANDNTSDAFISDDGRFVAYQSIDELLVDDDNNGAYDVFLYDRNTGETSRVSVDSYGNEGNSQSYALGLSGNGRYILFSSDATNLVNDDTNNTRDIFVHDASSGETRRTSLSANGAEGNNGSSAPGALTDDGFTVIYQSSASNLVPDDTNNFVDVFLNESTTTNTPLTLTITRLTNYSTTLDDVDKPDLYAKVWISPDDASAPPQFNNEGVALENVTNTEPFWVFSRPVSQFANRTVIIELWDKDSDSADDQADIHPAIGKEHITLVVDATGKWDGDVEWPQNCISGAQETAVEICWDISTLSDTGDADEDGLLDGWEINGFNQNGDTQLDVDLQAMGADPRHKDIFVEIDYMVDGGTSYRPKLVPMHNIIAAFNEAPVSNPDGSQGIHLHIDSGTDAPLFWGSTDKWSSLSGGNALPYQQNLGTCVGDNYNWTQFDQLKASYFDETRAPIFHYNIWADQLCPELDDTSGISRGDGASDFIVSLGGWAGVNGSILQQAGTFMHELGHNLGLKHGGVDEVNYKPNYLSVMNYSFQMTGPYINGRVGRFDYSRYNLPPLDENNLDETVGIFAAPGLALGTRYFCGGSPIPRIDTNAARIDWNCSGADTETGVTSNINGGYVPDATLGILTSQNDWLHLIYKSGAVGGMGTMYEGETETAVSEITQAEANTIPPWPEPHKVYLPVVVKP